MRKPGDLVRIKQEVVDGDFSFGPGTGVRVKDVQSLPGRLGVVVCRTPDGPGEAWYAVWLEGYEARAAIHFSSHEMRKAGP